MKFVFTLLLLLTSLSTWAEDLRINYETHFKISTAQSGSLSANQKCQVPAGTVIAADGISSTQNHYRLTLANQLSACAFTTGYFYAPHVDRESRLLTVHSNTVFKKRPLSSSQLPANEKCNLTPKVYASNGTVSAANGSHYFVSLDVDEISSCAFTSGYVFEGHSTRGVMAVQITAPTVFKKSNQPAASLPSADKCDMNIGAYVLGSPAQSAEGGHYRVTLANALSGCGFRTGYLYYDHTQLPSPGSDNNTTFTFPMPSGTLGSAWCVCRNIGTSPHIGQDIFRSGGMRAVAVQSGVLESTTFSSTCGYISIVRDDFNTSWRYVHLNNPVVSQGSRISKGQKLADISQYPLSGCGTGAHLHFERRSAGYFNDSATGKSCQNGYRSCYYDPIKPWRNTAATAFSETLSTQEELNWGNERTATPASCKVSPSDYTQVDTTLLARYDAAPGDRFENTLSRIARPGVADVIEGVFTPTKNPENQCADSTCITHWQLIAEADDGRLSRVFYENRLRNRSPVRDAREQYCIPENTRQLWVLAKDREGNMYKQKI